MLDMGTGGGEVLARLERPRRAVATEGYEPNVATAAARLAPLGIPVVRDEGAVDNVDQHEAALRSGSGGAAGRLPFADGAFGIVANRHEAFLTSEVARVLAPCGWFVTQQVDCHFADDFRAALGLPDVDEPETWLPLAREQAEQAGLQVAEAVSGAEELRFLDIGALTYYLRATSFSFPGLDLAASRPALRRLHDQMRDRPFTARLPHFLLIARKP
jgi:SAM-dependent methyltransferase